MEMHQIRYFLVLCEELHFTRAAEHCNVTQPSLTRAIKALEDELGGPLFCRERANTHLSELGKIVKPYLQDVYCGSENARRKAREFTNDKTIPLRLGLMCTIAPNHLLDFVKAVRVHHPVVRLQITDAAAPTLRDSLIAGDLDAAIYAMPAAPLDDRLHYMPLYRERFVIVMAADHRLAEQKAVRVRDLDGERYLSRANCEYDAPATKIFDEQRANCETVYESERDDWILAMAAAGLGIGFMPELSAGHPGIVARPLVEPEFWREISLVTVRGRQYSAAVGSLVREAMRACWNGENAPTVRALPVTRGKGRAA